MTFVYNYNASKNKTVPDKAIFDRFHALETIADTMFSIYAKNPEEENRKAYRAALETMKNYFNENIGYCY